jgi:hypothetical protein
MIVLDIPGDDPVTKTNLFQFYILKGTNIEPLGGIGLNSWV